MERSDNLTETEAYWLGVLAGGVQKPGAMLLYVTDPAHVPLVDELVVDGIVSVSRIAYVHSQHVLNVPVLAEDWVNQEEIASFGLWRKISMPWHLVMISLAAVKEYCVTDDQGIDTYFIEQLRFDPDDKLVTFVVVEGTRISAKVERLDMSVRMHRPDVCRSFHWSGPMMPRITHIEWPSNAEV